jgi:hypothetical protein
MRLITIKRRLIMASASKAQIKANRQNAKRSTGPTSIQGKLKVSQNAITHGIFANTPLLPHENEQEFSALTQDITATFPPVDAIAATLVERIIMTAWRQKRLQLAEAAKLQISMMPEIIAEEVSDILRLSSPRRLTAQSISERQEKAFQYWSAVLGEIENLNIPAVPEHLTKMSLQTPNVFKELKEKALASALSYDHFMKSPKEIIEALEEIKKYASDVIAVNTINHTGYKITKQLQHSKLIPDGDNLSFLVKYQVQLDTDIYRAIDAYKKHIAWRKSNLEIEVTDEVIEA